MRRFPSMTSKFHEKYAGYEEAIGHETAIWGLAHDRRSDLRLGPSTSTASSMERPAASRARTCHPSFSYRLENNGESLGGSSDWFDIQIERLAVYTTDDYLLVESAKRGKLRDAFALSP